MNTKLGSTILTTNLSADKSVKIHTYIAPEKAFGDASHVIETANTLVIIDVQYLLPYAKEFKQYVESLNKPVNRIFISHAHPDHYMGLTLWPNTDAYSLAQINETIKKTGNAVIKQYKPKLGAMLPNEAVYPTGVIELDNLVHDYWFSIMDIDGLKYTILPIYNAEDSVQLAFYLPKYETMFAQDVMFSNYHPYIAKPDFDKWIENIKFLRDYPSDAIFMGHGSQWGTNAYEYDIKYLQTAKQLYDQYQYQNFKGNSGPQMYKHCLIEAYPNMNGVGIIDLYLPELFI